MGTYGDASEYLKISWTSFTRLNVILFILTVLIDYISLICHKFFLSFVNSTMTKLGSLPSLWNITHVLYFEKISRPYDAHGKLMSYLKTLIKRCMTTFIFYEIIINYLRDGVFINNVALHFEKRSWIPCVIK